MRARAYPPSMPSKNRSEARNSRPRRSSERARSKREAIMGVSVKDTTAETKMATLSVTANSRKSRPTTPPMSRMGMKTASSEAVMETMVKPICFAPFKAACIGRSPASM